MYAQHREEFIARVALLMPDATAYYAAAVARKLMRHASTLQRLAVAQCNGDWPADNGQRATEPCPLCDTSWAPSAIVGGQLAMQAYVETARMFGPAWKPRACPDCRTAAAIRAIVREHLPTQQAVFTGDPRGYVVRLAPAAASREDIDTGRAPIIYIPGRE